MTVRELVNLLTSDGIDPDWPILQGFQELNMQRIHQSQLSSVKIDTDGKGNAKPSVHVYHEDPGEAAKIAAQLYEWVRGEVNPEQPEPVSTANYELFDKAWRKRRREDVPYALMSFGFTADQVAWIMGQEEGGG